MVLTIPVPTELVIKLRERAEASGKDVSAYVIEAVEEKLRAPANLTELLAPIHAQTHRSGMSEQELDDLIEECRDEVHAAKRAARRP